MHPRLFHLSHFAIALLNRNDSVSSMGKWGGLGQNLKMEKPKFPNLLILEHLKSHFIKSQLTK